MRRYVITTPEMIKLHFELAGLYSRAIAFLLDAAVIIVSSITVAFAVGMALRWLASYLAYTAVTLVPFAIVLGYFPVFEIYLHGRTPGKRLMGLRVIDADGRRLAASAVIIRNMARLVDFLPEWMLLGGMVALADKWHRRIGDFAAQTVVIREDRAILPAGPTGDMRRRDNSFLTDAAIRWRILERISLAQRDVIFDLALRRDQLEVASREGLFQLAARQIQNTLSLRREQYEHLSDEQYILNVTMVLQEGWFKG